MNPGGHGLIVIKDVESLISILEPLEQEVLFKFFKFFEEETHLQMMSKKFFCANLIKASRMCKFKSNILFEEIIHISQVEQLLNETEIDSESKLALTNSNHKLVVKDDFNQLPRPREKEIANKEEILIKKNLNSKE